MVEVPKLFNSSGFSETFNRFSPFSVVSNEDAFDQDDWDGYPLHKGFLFITTLKTKTAHYAHDKTPKNLSYPVPPFSIIYFSGFLLSVKRFSYLAELIFNEVMTRSVSWLINSATSPFQLPFTIPPQAPSFTRLRAKSNERSLENLVSRSTQKPEQHLNIVEFEFLISSVLLTLTVSQKHSFIGLQRLKIDLNLLPSIWPSGTKYK